MSRNEMVSVPRELLDASAEWLEALSDLNSAERGVAQDLREILAQPAEQHQGEPVALPACKARLSGSHDWDQGYRDGWTACRDEIAKLGPLYTRPVQGDPTAHSLAEKVREALDRQACPNAWMVIAYEAVVQNFTHADPAEAERLRCEVSKWRGKDGRLTNERDGARAQLAERDALLRDSYAELLAIKAEIGFRGATIALIGRIDAALSASAKPKVTS